MKYSKKKSPKKKSPRMKSSKKKSPKKKFPRKKSPRKKSPRKKSSKKKSPKMKSPRMKSSKKKSPRKKSSKKKSFRKKSVQFPEFKIIKYLNDGMDEMDERMESIRPIQSFIKLENYIENINLFYDKSFTYTISAFKMFKTNGIQNDTFDLIKELFNFHTEYNINEIFHNKFTVLAIIIINGLYDKFEQIIDSIKIISKGEGYIESKIIDEVIDCNRRRSDSFDVIKVQHRLKLSEEQLNYLNNIITDDLNAEINNFILDIKVNGKKIRKKFITDSLEDEIKKFLYYSVCVESDIRKYIMRHYFLNFIKSNDFTDYKNILDITSTGKNKEIIDNFLMNIVEYKHLPYINLTFTKDDNIKYNFSSCGETTLLNLLNYYFINKKGDFNVTSESPYSANLIDFYSEYNIMEKQIKDVRKTTEAWLKVVSNLKKSDVEEKDVRLYNSSGDIHNNLKNIIFVLKTILKKKDVDVEDVDVDVDVEDVDVDVYVEDVDVDVYVEDVDVDVDVDMEDNNEINKILKKISHEHKLEIIKETENEIEFLLDNKYTVFFKPGHADILFKQVYINKLEIKDINSDFGVLYNYVFSKIDYKDDYTVQLSKKFIECCKSIDKNILLSFFINIVTLNLSNNQLTALPDSIGKLTNLVILNLSYNQLKELPPDIGKLTNLTHLYISRNQLKELPPDIGKLTYLEHLYISGNQLKELPPDIGKLTNLTHLYISRNQLKELPPDIGKLTYLEHLWLDSNQLKELPPDIGKLTNLVTLNLSNNQLIKLPDSIGNLTDLITLNLNSNQLKELPPDIGKLTKLITLHLMFNKITADKLSALPDSIKKIKNFSVDFFKKI